MKQAKLRGTFKQRRKEDIQLKITNAEKERHAERDWWDSLTDEQKKEYVKEQEYKAKAQIQAAQMFGFAWRE